MYKAYTEFWQSFVFTDKKPFQSTNAEKFVIYHPNKIKFKASCINPFPFELYLSYQVCRSIHGLGICRNLGGTVPANEQKSLCFCYLDVYIYILTKLSGRVVSNTYRQRSLSVPIFCNRKRLIMEDKTIDSLNLEQY